VADSGGRIFLDVFVTYVMSGMLRTNVHASTQCVH